MTRRRRSTFSRLVTATLAVTAGIGALVVPSLASAPAGAATLPRPEGAGPPVPGSGIGTTAALDNPRCHKTSPSGDSL